MENFGSVKKHRASLQLQRPGGDDGGRATIVTEFCTQGGEKGESYSLALLHRTSSDVGKFCLRNVSSDLGTCLKYKHTTGFAPPMQLDTGTQAQATRRLRFSSRQW